MTTVGDYTYEWITRDGDGRLHLYQQACGRDPGGPIYGGHVWYEVERHSPEAVAAMAAAWGLRRRHGDPAETVVEDGHTLVAHRMTRTK